MSRAVDLVSCVLRCTGRWAVCCIGAIGHLARRELYSQRRDASDAARDSADWAQGGAPARGGHGIDKGKVTYEHIYWDQGSLLAQVGLLDPAKLQGDRLGTGA
jgi:hypothetical protein